MTKGRALVRSEGRERVYKHSAPLHGPCPSAHLQRPQKRRKSAINPFSFRDKLKAGAGSAAALALLLYCAAADGIMEAGGPGGFLAVSAVILTVCAALISISATAEHYPQHKEALNMPEQFTPSTDKLIADLTQAKCKFPSVYVAAVALICRGTRIGGIEYVLGYSERDLTNAVKLLQEAIESTPQEAAFYQGGINHIRRHWLPQITGRRDTYGVTQ